MDILQDKVDEMTLALLYLVRFHIHQCPRAWKSFDWDTLDRLHEKGWISDPKTKAKSVALSEEGLKLAKEFFERHFQK